MTGERDPAARTNGPLARTNTVQFHLISLIMVAIGVTLIVVGREVWPLLIVLFFGGGWVATQALRRNDGTRRWPLIVGAIGTFCVAAGCAMLWPTQNPSRYVAAVGALFFGYAGIRLLIRGLCLHPTARPGGDSEGR